MVFRYTITLRWGQCDPAAIVYYPHYFDLFHQAMEAWFGECLDMPYHEVILGEKLGLPSVHAEADFHAPSRFGERLAVELRVDNLGRSSIAFGYRVTDEEGGIRASGAVTCALMDLDPQRPTYRRAVPITPPLRAKILEFCAQ